MTTGQVYNDFLNRLGQIYEVREAANIADWVFEHVTGLKKMERRTGKDMELDGIALSQIGGYLNELLQHRPIQYVLKEAWFYKMKFFVNEEVLIPRPETEELVSWIVKDVAGKMQQMLSVEFNILDIGTGSGCIAISLKKEIKDVGITALDVSSGALAVAKKNAEMLGTLIDFQQLDFLDERCWNGMGMYDVIVSNPPYIPEKEKEKLPENVRSFEPATALFVQDDDPLIFYAAMAKFARSHLKPGGKIFAEMHEEHYAATEQVFIAGGYKTEIKEDIYGKKRMIRCEMVSNFI